MTAFASCEVESSTGTWHKLSLKLILFFSFAYNWFQISFSVCKTAALAFPDGCKWMKFVLLTALLWGKKDNVSFKAGHKGRALNESHLPETHITVAEVADTTIQTISPQCLHFHMRATAITQNSTWKRNHFKKPRF